MKGDSIIQEKKLTFKCGFQYVLEHVQTGGKPEDQTNVSFEIDIYA